MSELISLPLFPLNLVVFPGEDLNLHIFEERYRELIHECKSDGISFGIPFFRGEGSALKYGTSLTLLSIEKVYPDGRMDIKTKGQQVFEIQSFESKMYGKLYPGGKVQFKDPIDSDAVHVKEEIIEGIQEMYEIMKIDKPIPSSSASFFSYQVAHHIGMTPGQEYEVLSKASEDERLDFILTHLRSMVPATREMENLRLKVQMNGHFKNIIPPKV